MILQRITIRYKFGKTNEAIALLKAEIERGVKMGFFREDTRTMRPWRDDQLSEGELVWDSHAQAVEMWGKWESDPGSKPFLDAWVPLVEEGSKTEWLHIA